MTDDLPANLEGPDQSDSGALPDGALTEHASLSPLPFDGLVAPEPLPTSPPESARWLAFAGILVGGLLGGLIGYGTADLLTMSGIWSAVGGLIGQGWAGLVLTESLAFEVCISFQLCVLHPGCMNAA